MSGKYFAYTVDTECDKGPRWTTPLPITCRNITDELFGEFHPLLVAAGAKPTYVVSPEVLEDQSASQALLSLPNEFELGTHLHGEYIDPGKNMEARGTFDMQRNYDADTEWQKLRNLTDLFTQVCGYRPRVFRAGRYGIAHRTTAMLEKLGYAVDSSVTPFKWWDSNVNFIAAPPFPYFPSYENINEPGEAAVLEIPLSVHPGVFRHVHRRIRRKLNPYGALFNRAFSFWNRRIFKIKPVLLNVISLTMEELRGIVDWYSRLHVAAGTDTVLVMTCHSCEARPGANPYIVDRVQQRAFYDRTRQTIEYALNQGFVPMTLGGVADSIRPSIPRVTA